MQKDVPTTTLIIPAHNEARTVGAVVDQARSVVEAMPGIASPEILVIDDASTDGSADAARAAGARVVVSSRQLGYGASIKRGLRRANGEVIVILDADGTYPTAAIRPLLEAVLEGADHAVGARTGDSVAVPRIRRPAKWFVGRLAEGLTGQAIPDLNSGLRCFSADIARRYIDLLPNGFSLTTTLTVATLLEGLEVIWVPIDYHARVGRSKFRAIRDTANLLYCLVRAVATFRPMRVFGSMAALCAAVGLGTGVWDVFIQHNVGDTTVLLALGALQLASLGLIADLVVRRVR